MKKYFLLSLIFVAISLCGDLYAMNAADSFAAKPFLRHRPRPAGLFNRLFRTPTAYFNAEPAIDVNTREILVDAQDRQRYVATTSQTPASIAVYDPLLTPLQGVLLGVGLGIGGVLLAAYPLVHPNTMAEWKEGLLALPLFAGVVMGERMKFTAECNNNNNWVASGWHLSSLIGGALIFGGLALQFLLKKRIS